MKNKNLKAFDNLVGLFAITLTIAFVLWKFQAQITSVKMFSIVMTLGGLESYNDTVVGILMLTFLVGVYLAARD